MVFFSFRAFFGCPQLRCISSDGYFCGFESSVSVGREAFAGCPLLTGHRNRLALVKGLNKFFLYNYVTWLKPVLIVAPGIIDHLPQRSGPNGGLVCRYGAYCSRDKDCVAGNTKDWISSISISIGQNLFFRQETNAFSPVPTSASASRIRPPFCQSPPVAFLIMLQSVTSNPPVAIQVKSLLLLVDC